jgi:transcriptional regulator with PAS, ATPase and Fis domain
VETKEEALIKRELQRVELLSNVVEATADAVIVTDRGGRIEYVNPAHPQVRCAHPGALRGPLEDSGRGGGLPRDVHQSKEERRVATRPATSSTVAAR